MTTQIVRKTLAATVAVALVAGSLSTSASASDRGFQVKPVQKHGKIFGGLSAGQKKGAAIGALIGIGGALLGAAIVNSQPRHVEPRRHGFRDDGFRPAGYGQSAYTADEDCYDKPVKRFDRATGGMIVVGTTEVCE